MQAGNEFFPEFIFNHIFVNIVYGTKVNMFKSCPKGEFSKQLAVYLNNCIEI